MAARVGADGSEQMERLRELGQLSSLRADLAKSKALEWLLDNVELVDESGAAVDLRAAESSEATDQDEQATDEPVADDAPTDDGDDQ